MGLNGGEKKGNSFLQTTTFYQYVIAVCIVLSPYIFIGFEVQLLFLRRLKLFRNIGYASFCHTPFSQVK